jgi:uncharacterized membrane protein YozB (DUF420 family)
MSLQDLPPLNAGLNGLSTLLLIAGWISVRRRMLVAHRACMVAAFASSSVFLACYLYYHFHAGRTVFVNPQWFRPFYLAILITHTILAITIVPMILTTFAYALRGDFTRHRRIAKWTLPLWLYVSVTGVVIYYLLYVKFPQK